MHVRSESDELHVREIGVRPNLANGAHGIEWRPIEIEENHVGLVLADAGQDVVPFAYEDDRPARCLGHAADLRAEEQVVHDG